jgi:hypothetical protein
MLRVAFSFRSFLFGPRSARCKHRDPRVTIRARFSPPTYLNITTTLSECSHFGHSKVRRSNPG